MRTEAFEDGAEAEGELEMDAGAAGELVACVCPGPPGIRPSGGEDE